MSTPPPMERVTITVAAGTYEGVLAGWELPGRRRTLRLLFASPVHGGSVRGLAPAATAGGAATARGDGSANGDDGNGSGSSQAPHRLLVSCGYDESLQLHNFTRRRTSAGLLRTPAELGTPVCLQLAPPPPPLIHKAALPLAPSSTHCLVGFASGRLALYQRRDWSLVHVLAPGHAGGVASVAVHPSGRLALSGGRADGRLQLWDLRTGKAAYGHAVQPPPGGGGRGRPAGPPRREPIDTIVWSPPPPAEDADADGVDATAGAAYAYCYGRHVTVRDVVSDRDLLDAELPSRVNQICFLRPGDAGAGLFLAAAGNDGSLAVLKVGSPGDRSVERRAVMAIEPVDRAVAGEERFKCLQHIMGTIVATANSAGVISVMDLQGAVRMINAKPEGDEDADQEETPVHLDSDEDDSDDDRSVELAVDIIDSIQLGTGARITCLAAWAEEVDDKDGDETSEGPQLEKEVPAESIDEGEGHKRKRPLSSKDIVLAKDALERARGLVSDAKKIQLRKEKKRYKKRHGSP